MNSRERVLLAINHKEPDRLPMFRPNMIQTYEPLDERVKNFLDTFEFDHFVGFNHLMKSPIGRKEISKDVFEDPYGCVYKYMGVGLPYCIHHPLANIKSVEEVEKYNWPDPDDAEVVSGAREKAREIFEKTEHATSVGVNMIFHQYDYMRGFEQWMMDIAINPEIHKAIADRIHHINKALLIKLLDEVGDYTDIVSTGDDLGTSTAPYMSPDDFRNFIKPYFKDLIDEIKGKFPHIKFYLHSHGQIMPYVADLIDCGVDILNPILPLDNMDPAKLKNEFGQQLSFEGGIDIEHVLPYGTLNEVRDHVTKVIDIMAPGGGFLFKAQAISWIIPYENLMETYRLAMEYKGYNWR